MCGDTKQMPSKWPARVQQLMQMRGEEQFSFIRISLACRVNIVVNRDIQLVL